MSLKNGFFGGTSISDALHVVIGWVEALHGRAETAASLRDVLHLVNGHRGSILRIQLDTCLEALLARAEVMAPERSMRDEGISFAQYLLGHGLGQAQPGSIWYLSELAREIAADERSGVRLCPTDHRTREIAVLVLEPRKLTSDILELQFPQRLSKGEAEALSTLSAVLSRGWRHRNPSAFPLAEDEALWTELRRETSADAILVPGNPARLSRSEYRVCDLVSRGLGAKAISHSLRISESTVRSHLRSIYAKTRTRGQRELMFKLLASGGGRAITPLPVPTYAGGRSQFDGRAHNAD